MLKRWHDSLELHARYLALDDDRYQHIQPWPRHERPARWIVELAREKVLVLAKLVEQRGKAGDTAFIEALELMGFLSTLVGLSSVERFIPLCDPSSERREVMNAAPPRSEASPRADTTARRDTASPATAAVRAPATVAATDDHTREMPALPQGPIGRMLLAQQAGVPYRVTPEARRSSTRKRGNEAVAQSARVNRPAAPKTSTPATSTRAATAAAVAPTVAPPTGADAIVVDDALRLLGWGRQWHELPEIIARLADRPSPSQIRRALREQRALIEKRHRAAQS